MKPSLGVTLSVIASSLWLTTSPAFALGVPVGDAVRLDDETGVANCMTRVRGSTDSTVQPTTGVHKSMASPGSAKNVGQAQPVGGDSLTGTAVQASGAAAGISIGGLDLSPLFKIVNGAGAIQGATYGQVLSAIQSVDSAVPKNTTALQGIGALIGQADGLQGAWDQNSNVRVGGASVWNQALQIANTLATLRNQMLMRDTSIASSQAKMMTYDSTKASFASKQKTPAPDNETATETRPATIGDILQELQAAQDAARAAVAGNPQN